jgi:alkylation response protein AidB-like acyl-CoA dehydrogenase
MNFDFSSELNEIRSQAHAFLRDHASRSARQALENTGGFDAELWQRVAELGWVGAAIPEEYGGIGLGEEGMCVIAEELGRSLAAIPMASTAYLAAQAVLQFGSEAQKTRLLPKLADGSLIGCFALAEGLGAPSAESIRTRLSDGRLRGTKRPVVDGGVANMAVLVARAGDQVVLCLAELDGAGVARSKLETVDPSREASEITFDDAEAEALPNATGWSSVELLLDRAAVWFAFEQLGGAQACLDMARDYALERRAFGRQIGSFQAIKHKLADCYIAIELARSNAYYGAYALRPGAPDLAEAAAAARVAATHAFNLASQENIQTHGGMGFTWESDCHLFYRRARHLALAIGAAPFWKDRLIGALEMRNAA